MLCDEWEANLTNPNQDTRRAFLNQGQSVKPYGTLGQFRRHLGRHMEQLALFALPMNETDKEEDERSDANQSDVAPDSAQVQNWRQGSVESSASGSDKASNDKDSTQEESAPADEPQVILDLPPEWTARGSSVDELQGINVIHNFPVHLQNHSDGEGNGSGNGTDGEGKPVDKEGSVVAVPDPETEKKLLAVAELMQQQKIELDKLQKELADKAEKEAKEMGDKIEKVQKTLEKAQKEINERNAKQAAGWAALDAARESAEEKKKAAWEKKIERDKQVLAEFEEAQRKAILATAERVKKDAEEKAAWERKVEDEKKQALVEFEAAQRKAAEDAAAAAAKAKEEQDGWGEKLKEEKELAMAEGVYNAKKVQEAEKKKTKEAAAAAELEEVKKEAAKAEKKEDLG